MRGKERRASAVTAAVLLAAACNRAPSPEQAGQQSAPAGPVLFAVKTRVESSERLEVGLGACTAGMCPVEIRLTDGRTTKHMTQAAWPATSAMPEQVAPDATMGIGDPLAPSENARVWTTGSGEATVVTAARPVRLADGRNAVLLDQMAGSEHPKRRHDLFAAADGKVAALWSSAEQQGPYWSTVAVRPNQSSLADELVVFTIFSPGGADPDALTVERLESTPGTGVLRASPSPPMNVAVVGTFPSVEAARAAKEKQPDCLAPFSVIDSRRAGLQTLRGVILAAVSTRRELAEQALQRASECEKSATVRVVESTAIPAGVPQP